MRGSIPTSERAPLENVPLLPRGLEAALGNILEALDMLRGERELYNLTADPYESKNLYGVPSQCGRVRTLSENLAKLKNAAGEKVRALEEAQVIYRSTYRNHPETS